MAPPMSDLKTTRSIKSTVIIKSAMMMMMIITVVNPHRNVHHRARSVLKRSPARSGIKKMIVSGKKTLHPPQDGSPPGGNTIASSNRKRTSLRGMTNHPERALNIPLVGEGREKIDLLTRNLTCPPTYISRVKLISIEGRKNFEWPVKVN